MPETLAAALAGIAHADPAGDFRASDANGDGALDKAEFKAFIDRRADAGGSRAGMVRTHGLYDRAFARVDKNGDGIVSKEELKR